MSLADKMYMSGFKNFNVFYETLRVIVKFYLIIY